MSLATLYPYAVPVCEVCGFDLRRADSSHRARPGSRFCTVCNDRIVNPPASSRRANDLHGGRPGEVRLYTFEARLEAGKRLHAELIGDRPGWGRYEGVELTGLMYQRVSTPDLLAAFLEATS